MVTAVGLLGACGGHGRIATPPRTTSTTVPATTTTTRPKAKPHPKPIPTAPLTGLVDRNLAQLRMPAVVVKIDNVDAARPQTGLNQADVVYEEMVEGGLTRLAAIYQSQYPAVVGPVRSGRLTDAGIADNLNHPVLAYSGTNGLFLPILRSQPVTDVDGESHPGLYWRSDLSYAPHNLYTDVVHLASVSTTHAPPRPLFYYHSPRATFSGAGVARAVHIGISFPATSVTWDFDARSRQWLRGQNGSADTDRSGQRMAATNIVIQFISYGTSALSSGEGAPPAPIPAGQLVGKGVAWFFSQGRIVEGTWTRSKLTWLTSFRDRKGAPIRLTPGRTWIELLPLGVQPSVVP
jgi:hypothetical protein